MRQQVEEFASFHQLEAALTPCLTAGPVGHSITDIDTGATAVPRISHHPFVSHRIPLRFRVPPRLGSIDSEVEN
ncbi:hypothetical protein NJ76_22180 [Rhodococcus sp. IITR03]|nr:hypothetical protein NJ76_22180 [Rhodococcus sp. IITR03]